MTVRMTHPDLEGRVIEVAAISVCVYERSGWQVQPPENMAAAWGRRQTGDES